MPSCARCDGVSTKTHCCTQAWASPQMMPSCGRLMHAILQYLHLHWHCWLSLTKTMPGCATYMYVLSSRCDASRAESEPIRIMPSLCQFGNVCFYNTKHAGLPSRPKQWQAPASCTAGCCARALHCPGGLLHAAPWCYPLDSYTGGMFRATCMQAWEHAVDTPSISLNAQLQRANVLSEWMHRVVC